MDVILYLLGGEQFWETLLGDKPNDGMMEQPDVKFRTWNPHEINSSSAKRRTG